MESEFKVKIITNKFQEGPITINESQFHQILRAALIKTMKLFIDDLEAELETEDLIVPDTKINDFTELEIKFTDY